MTQALSLIKEKLTASAAYDKYVLWIVLGLAAVGTVAVYSAITYLAETKAGGDPEFFLWRHLLRVGIAFGAMGLVSLIDYRTLARYSKVALLGALGLLLAVQIVGVAVGGAERWIRIGSFGFQPSDLAKVALVLYLGVLLAKKQSYIKSFGRAFLPIMLWILATVVLIGLDDLSTAAVVLTAALLMCFVGRVSFLQLVGLGLVGAMLGGMLLMDSPHRAARVEAYLGIDLFEHTDERVFDRQAEGYQAHQARIAIAMGGLTGVGPGKSVQRDFLPAPYNDFIFAIIAEEYGIVLGALGLLALFCALLFRGFLRIARHAPDPLGLFLGVGFTTMIVLYGFIHAGVASGLLPVTGLPMPLVSYGGTSMVTTGIMVGVLLNISRQSTPNA
jgi:cell division protein FtsW